VGSIVLSSKLRGVSSKIAGVDCATETEGSEDSGFSNPEEDLPAWIGEVTFFNVAHIERDYLFEIKY
jgi:hypothetical protein